jgi:uncharacterized protein (DUF2147 family)
VTGLRPLLTVLALLAPPAWADPLEGLWRTAPDIDGRIGFVRIAPCGAMLCGTLEAATDVQGRRLTTPDIGRRLIWDTVLQGANTYRGRVYSPARQAEYDSRLTLSGDRLLVEACLLGQCRGGEPWARVD